MDEESPVTAVPMKGRCEEVIFPFFLGASGVGCATTPLFIHRGMPLGQPSVVGSGGAMCVCMCLCGVLVSVMSRPGGAGPSRPSFILQLPVEMILSSGRISLLVADGADLQVSFAKTAVVQVIFQQQGSRSSSCCWSVLPALVPTSKLPVASPTLRLQ